MPKNRWILVAVLMTGWLLHWAFCPRLEAGPETRFCVDVWGTEDGLPQSSVITMTQTRDGYLWLGTVNGLVRFDGIHFTIYDESNVPGLNNSCIVHLFEDGQENLWIGTETAGAALLKNGKVISLDIGRGHREGRLRAACQDAAGAIWLYTADGQLCRFQNSKGDIWKIGDGYLSRCRSLIAEKSGLVWVGTDRGLFFLDPAAVRTGANLPSTQQANVGKVDFLLAGSKGGHWLLADGSIQQWSSTRLERRLSSYPWPRDVEIQAACEDQEGNLIVGTRGQGVFWFNAEGKATHLGRNEGLSNDSILSLHADKQGTLWVGTDGGGLNRVKPQIFKLLDKSLGLTVQSVCEDGQGGLWFSSNEDGIDRCQNGVLDRWNSRFGSMSRFNVRALLKDDDQNLWACTIGVGLFCRRNEIFQEVAAEGVHPEISAIHQDRGGHLWLGTRNGLARRDGNQWTVFTTKDGLSADSVRAIADDPQGNVWIGTERGGLNCFRNGHFTSYQQRNGFPTDNISSLFVDGEGVLWVGTFGNGLIRFQAGKWTRYTTREGLISNSIGYIIEDRLGSLWIGSNRGLMRVQRKALNEFAQGATQFILCHAYGKRDGLPHSECTVGSQPAAYLDHEGKLWFPTIAGLVSVDPAQLRSNLNPPPVVIESVLIGYQEKTACDLRAPVPQAVTVPADQVHIEISYSSLDLASADRARFKYRLENHETGWTDAGNSRVVRYTQLPPGSYRFQVTACNEDGAWNPAGASVAITVLPPFWRTWWFLTATTTAFLGIVAGMVYFVSTQRLQRQLEGLRQQQALEKERARIARDIHDQVGASLTQVSLLGEMVESDKDLPQEVEAHARQISQTTRETARALDEIVWTVNPSNDTLDGLITYVCKYAQDYFSVAGLRYRLEVPSELPASPISPEVRHNLFLAAKEAITNVVRHARASEAWIRLHLETASFTLEIEDNGRGPAGLEKKSDRNGLRNMRKRMEDIGGEFSIAPGPQGGALVRLTAPIHKR